ncbi:MAG TPA: VOC family protein [Pyrinomonadaceae bacterium]|jgi:predicted 3-demethylubiquinone-9 3-methyltransferase (glyoxalase superfamily)|nr:VOC family protein [Pyrinomonadaceae bacterium]
MQKITTFLTFEKKGAEAVNFYGSIFKNSKIHGIHQYEDEGGPLPKGALLHASFELDGQRFMAMDGGPHFKFEQGFSLFVNAETQEEIDRLSSSLTEDGGEQQPCGWVKDKYGISWQIVPPILGELMGGPDRERAGRVMQAMLKMKKLDIQALKDA